MFSASICEVLLLSGSRFEAAVAGAGADTVGCVDSMATGLPFVTPILTTYNILLFSHVILTWKSHL